MTTIPIPNGDGQPRECAISNQTLIVSAGTGKALAVLNAPGPLLLPPGSVLQFDGPPGELVVTSIRVIAGHDGGIVCAEAEPASTPARYRGSPPPGRSSERPGHLRPAPDQPPRWTAVRPGNG